MLLEAERESKEVLARALDHLAAERKLYLHWTSVWGALDVAARNVAAGDANRARVLWFDAVLLLAGANGTDIEGVDRRFHQPNLTLQEVRPVFEAALES